MRSAYFQDSDMTLYQGDAVEVLRDLPAGSVHMACTSPPFFGLRDYGTGAWEGGDEGCDHLPENARRGVERRTSTLGGGVATITAQEGANSPRETCPRCGARRIDSQIGLESSPDEWAARLVDVFREVRRVLRDDGTLWVECGDSYCNAEARKPYGDQDPHGRRAAEIDMGFKRREQPPGTKPKDLLGQPWLLAFALRADGWYLRSCIVWSKPNAMPESVTDRPTTGHSYVFLFSKKPRYFYDAEALREPLMESTIERSYTAAKAIAAAPKNDGDDRARKANGWEMPTAKNARTVWTIPTEPNALAICRVCDAYWQGGAPREHCGEPVVQHFAAFPRELVRRMILAGTSERGVCAECGAPWVREMDVGESDYAKLKREHGHEWTDMDAVSLANGTTTKEGEGGQTRKPNGTVPSLRAAQRTHVGWMPSCLCGTVDVPEVQHDDMDEESVRDSLPLLRSSLAPSPPVVLDPFSGSGTTLLIARSLGRHAIGVELNERYCAMTKARTHQLSVLG